MRFSCKVAAGILAPITECIVKGVLPPLPKGRVIWARTLLNQIVCMPKGGAILSRVANDQYT